MLVVCIVPRLTDDHSFYLHMPPILGFYAGRSAVQRKERPNDR